MGVGEQLWTIELSGEVDDWYSSLRTKDRAQADAILDKLKN